MKSITIIFASAIIGYAITDTLYMGFAYGGVAVCAMAVYSLWKDDREIKKEQAAWARLTKREREDRQMMITRMAKVEMARNELGADYVFSPDYTVKKK